MNQLGNKLHFAVVQKDKDAVACLINQGVNVNRKDKESGMSPLHFAVKHNDMEIAKMLLNANAKINEASKYESTALLFALDNENEEMMRFLLKCGANVNSKKFGKTPLRVAVENQAVHLVQLLLEHGSIVNEVSVDGQTPLQIAVEKGDKNMVEVLLRNGARADVKNFGKYPLYNAVKNDCLEIAKLLYAANRNSKDAEKQDVFALSLAFTEKKKHITHAFLELGMNPNAKINSSYPLHIACEYEWLDTVELLLAKGADVTALSANKNTSPLHLALQNNNDRLVELLLQQPTTDVNQKQLPSGLTPLHIAVQNNNVAMTRLLLAHGAKANVMSNLGVVPLHQAFEKNNRELIDALMTHGADTQVPKSGASFLEYSVEHRWVDLVKLLLEQGGDPNVKTHNDHDHSLLVRAIKYRELDIVQLLLSHGADPNVLNAKTQRSPLQCAVLWRCPAIAVILIQNGASVDYVSPDGTTALHCALEKYDEEMTRLLIDAGANHRLPIRRKTTLHFACKSGWYEIARLLLLDPETDVNAQTSYNATALFYAINRNDLAMCKLLLEHGADVHHRVVGRTMLIAAVALQNQQIVRLLIDNNARINDTNDVNRDDGYNALFLALMKGDDEMALMLVGMNADLFMRDPTTRRTPLHEAVKYNCMNTVKKLIARGASVHAKDRYKDTALHIAASLQHHELVKLLLNHKADPNLHDRRNKFTPLHFSLQVRDYETAKLLLNEGARIHFRDSPLGQTAFVYVLRHVRDERILRLLLTHDYYSTEQMNVNTDVLPYLSQLPSNRPPIAQAILRHLVRKGVPFAHLPSQNAYLLECEAEMTMMRQVFCYENVTFHALLTRNIQQMTLLAANSELVDAFEQSDYKTMFPIYGKVLESNVEWARERYEVMSDAEAMLGKLFNVVCEPLINRKILSHLSPTDLRVLSQLYRQTQPVKKSSDAVASGSGGSGSADREDGGRCN